MVQWNIDRVYTICPKDWDVLYPSYIRFGDIVLGYTGYVSDRWINSWQNPKSHDMREIDVSYRASKLPANFGSLGILKSEIATRFLEAIPNCKLRVDISTDSKDMIPGHLWHEFMENSRFCLMTGSGSSLLDETGSIRKKVRAFCSEFPDAGFTEIERNCFPKQDCKYLFNMISPRNIEAALAETVQIGTPGLYSGLLKPMEHYIPLEEDCSNISEVLLMMNDVALVERIKRKCKESILGEPRLRRTVIVDEMLHFAETVVKQRNIVESDQAAVERLFGRYEHEIEGISNRFWFKRRMRTLAARWGPKHIKNKLLALKAKL